MRDLAIVRCVRNMGQPIYKSAFHWTRLSCRAFRNNEVRLHLHALAYNLATFLRCIELPEAMADWSLTSLQLKLIKIGTRVVRHARAITFQLAEVAVTGPMVSAIRSEKCLPSQPRQAILNPKGRLLGECREKSSQRKISKPVRLKCTAITMTPTIRLFGPWTGDQPGASLRPRPNRRG